MKKYYGRCSAVGFKIVCKEGSAWPHYRRDITKTFECYVEDNKPFPLRGIIGTKNGLPVFNHAYDLAAYAEQEGYIIDGLTT